MIKSLPQITICCLFIFFNSAAVADSFFDVFFDITYDQASQAPQLHTSGRVINFGTGSRAIETEILSMDLSSYQGPKANIKRYASSVAVRSWVPNQDGKTQRLDSFFDIFYRCSIVGKATAKCVITDVQPITKGKHRGHVTVLK